MGNKRDPFLPDTLYHVYNHGNGNDNIFQCDENFYYFLMKYNQYIVPIADTFTYCLMPNHYHFALRIKDEKHLKEVFMPKLKDPKGFENLSGLTSQTFGNFLNAYAKAYNKMFNRRGSLFLDSVKRKVVNEESYFTKLIHYIHFNPVHHGFVRDLKDWKHSGYHAFISKKATQLERESVLEWFGGQDDFIKFHRREPTIDFELEF